MQCNWATKFNIHICYMVTIDKNHFAGGTERGYDFLEANPHLVGSFITSTKQGTYFISIYVDNIRTHSSL